MNLKMTFQEINSQIDVDFGEVQEVNDGGFEKGYEVGKKDGYQDGVFDGQAESASKFGIVNEVTGTNIVTLDYVNENEHNVEVKLSSDTVTDFSGVEVTVIGKNHFRGTLERGGYDISSGKKAYSTNDTRYRCTDYIKIYDFLEYIIASRDFEYKYFWCLYYDENKQYLGVYNHLDSIPKGACYMTFYCVGKDATLNSLDDLVQLELGKTATQYEKPLEPKTYTANADGTVDGVTSIPPVMNLICNTNTNGVNISAKYYQCPSAEYDILWDNLQSFGTITNCENMFYGSGWNDKNLKPKHTMKPRLMTGCFRYCGATDLTEVLSKFDTSECTHFQQLCQDSAVEILPKFSVKSASNLNMIFYYAIKVRVIECIEDVNKGQTFNNAFIVCSELEDIKFTGEIGKTISFMHSNNLTNESAKNILQCLVNYFGTNEEFAYTVQFSTYVWQRLDAEGETSPTGTTWKKYIEDKGWLK